MAQAGGVAPSVSAIAIGVPSAAQKEVTAVTAQWDMLRYPFWNRPDDKGSLGLAGVHRYIALMFSDDRTVKVKITVKETAQPKQQNKLYTVETIELE
jgi:hypothetical protein